MSSTRLAISSLVSQNTAPPLPPPPPPPAPTPTVLRNGRGYWPTLVQPVLRYPFPHDDGEHDRLDQFHDMIYEAMQKRLHHGQIISNGRPRILDVGHGTGYWLSDMKSQYPNSELTGFDLASVMPNSLAVREGIRHLVFDFEQPQWPIHVDSMDFIHMSNLCGSVSDWVGLCATAYRYLRPGTGKLELVEFDWEPLCDDNTLSTAPNAPLNVWWREMRQASAHIGRPIEYPHNLIRHLEQMGYEIEHNENIRIQSYEDSRGDNDEDVVSLVARKYMLAMGRSPDVNGKVSRSFSGMSMELFTSVAQWTPAQVERLQDDLYRPIQQSAVHLYHRLRIVTARRRH